MWGGADFTFIRRRIAAIAPLFAALCITHAALYLGIHLGPGASSVTWVAPWQKFCARSFLVKSMALGWDRALFQFRTLAVSTLSYCMQFHALPRVFRKDYMACIARVWNMPALKLEIAYNVDAFGARAAFPRLEDHNAASIFRASAMSTQWQQCYDSVTAVLESDEVLVGDPWKAWREESVLFTAAAVRARLLSIPAAAGLPIEKGLQKAIVKILHDACNVQSFHTSCAASLSKLLGGPYSSADVARIQGHLAAVSAVLSFQSCSPSVRLLINAWPTAARFGKREVCPFRCTERDRVQHVLACSKLVAAARNVSCHPVCSAFCRAPLQCLSLIDTRIDHDGAMWIMFWTETIFGVHSCMKRAGSPSMHIEDAIRARLRHQATKSSLHRRMATSILEAGPAVAAAAAAVTVPPASG